MERIYYTKTAYTIFIKESELFSHIEVIFSFMPCNLNLIELIHIVVIQDGKDVPVRNAHLYQVAQKTMVIALNH